MRKFINHSHNIERDSYIWNMAGSMLSAFQSVIFLAILTRVVDLVTAGIFTIANANANLFLNVGRFGMRNFQVSDVKEEYSFKTYHKSRIITVLLMLLCSVFYVAIASFFSGYSFEKSMIILWMCIFKIPDAYEDVFFGEYQRKGRLDIASKAMTLRMVLTIIGFSVLIILTHSVLISLMVSTAFTILLMVYFLLITKENIDSTKKIIADNKTNTIRLLTSCLPIFLASFLAFYIGNAPKYAIDAQLNDELQAIYGFISMPVFVIGLLNNFVFAPILFKISRTWEEGKIDKFKKIILKQTLIIFAITILCIGGAYILGIPILSYRSVGL